MGSLDVQQGMGPRDAYARSATHDISRASFHVKHIGQFAQRLEDVRLNQLLFAMGELQSNWRNVIVSSESVPKPWTDISAVQKCPVAADALGL